MSPNAHRGAAIDYAALQDGELVARVQAGDSQAFRWIMQRCNQRMFRVVRGVIHDEAEAEDVVQEAYLHAYQKIDGFRGESSVATWLTRIALNEAYGRLRRRRTTVDLDQLETSAQRAGSVIAFPNQSGGQDPAEALARGQLRRMLEDAVDELPEAFRLVYILRDVEGCSVSETAAALELREETVKTRLHRARRQLRQALQERFASSIEGAFQFLGERCQRMTDQVMARIAVSSSRGPDTP